MTTGAIAPEKTPFALLCSTRGASELLGGVDEDTVRMLVRDGELEAVKIQSRPGVEARKLHIVVASIEAYVDRLRSSQRAPTAEA